MKIGFLITYFYPRGGGAENNCYFIAKELAKRHEVHVFCSGEEDREDKISGIKVHRSKEVFRFRYYLSLYPKLLRKIRNYDLDVLHVHGLGFPQHDLFIRKMKKMNPKLKIVCTPHGPFMALKKYSLIGTILKRTYTKVIRRQIKNYDAFIEVNPMQEKWMVEEYGIDKKKIHFVPNGIPRESFEKIDSKYLKKISNKYGITDKFVISYLGRIQKYKGLDQILKIMPNLDKNVVFVAIGKDADDKKRLVEIAKETGIMDRVIFTGEVSEKDKLSLLDLSEIFVFPSEWEAFGIAMLEAMGKGNAIISSRTEGGQYLIKEGKNGLLFNYGNENELLRKMKRLIEDKKLRERIQKENIKRASDFTWDRISKDIEGVYNGKRK